MKKIYSYAPYSIDVSHGDKNVNDEGAILLKQSALLAPGQSTEVRELQSRTLDITKMLSKSSLSEYIREMTGAEIIVSTGDKLQIEFTAQSHRRNDGCTIHTIFDAKYGGSERLVSSERVTTMHREEGIDELIYYFVVDTFDDLLNANGFSQMRGNEIDLVKKIRDNDLIPGINLSGLDDEYIANNSSRIHNSGDGYRDIVRFLSKYTGLSKLDILMKISSLSKPTAEFDLSQLSFHFEYDIEIDEETFQSYFIIDSEEEYEAKLAAQAKSDQIKTNAKPKVLAKLEEVLSDYDLDDHDFDLEDLAEQIAECRDRAEVFDEIEDGDDDGFFSMVDSFAKNSTYVVHAYDGGCGHSLTGDRKDGHVYSFELGEYLINRWLRVHVYRSRRRSNRIRQRLILDLRCIRPSSICSSLQCIRSSTISC